MMLTRVISGGQTGVDRAGLDAARAAGIAIGGYCPKGRLAEDGVIPSHYPLFELDSPESYYRTEKNVLESDGTLILNVGELTTGTRLTQDFTVVYGKPCLVVQLDASRQMPPEEVVRWMERQYVRVLNVAGPRESKQPGGVYAVARDYLNRLFALVSVPGSDGNPS